MSVRDDVQALIRLELGKTKLGQQAVEGALTGEKAWGTSQEVNDLLIAYCTGLERAVWRLADEIDDLTLSRGEASA